MPRPLATLPAILLILCCATPATAAVFCVDTATELQNALSTAASNGEDDQVQIVQGTYVGNFVYTSSEAENIVISGGFVPGCGSRTIDPQNTVIDGNQSGTTLALISDFNSSANLSLHSLTITGGYSTIDTGNGVGGGIRSRVGKGGILEITHSVITNNYAGVGGGVEAENFRGKIRLIGNLIFNNQAIVSGGVFASMALILSWLEIQSQAIEQAITVAF